MINSIDETSIAILLVLFFFLAAAYAHLQHIWSSVIFFVVFIYVFKISNLQAVLLTILASFIVGTNSSPNVFKDYRWSVEELYSDANVTNATYKWGHDDDDIDDHQNQVESFQNKKRKQTVTQIADIASSAADLLNTQKLLIQSIAPVHQRD